MKVLVWACCIVLGLAALPISAADAPQIELKDGDRIAFIGNTLVERDQDAAYIEAALLTRFPNRAITFRNLGYSADTTSGDARGLCIGWSQFEGADRAFQRLRKLVAEYKPTVLLIDYGMTESFSGSAKLPDFIASYGKMLDSLAEAAGASPRVVLMSPNYHEDLGRPLPDPAEHNKNLKLYSDAIDQIAARRGGVYIDLYGLSAALAKTPPGVPLTWNGIHLTSYGYWRTALALQSYFGEARQEWQVELTATGNVAAAVATKISDVKAGADTLQFTATDAILPAPPAPLGSPKAIVDGSAAVPGTIRVLRVSGLKPGIYELQAADQVLARASADEWARGARVIGGPGAKQAEEIRALIAAKDFDYFCYQRPDNDSYILAFRKGEQGRNAVEIPQFLPLLQEKEKQIATLCSPRPVVYTLQLAK